MYQKIFQQPYCGKIHKTSASHFNQRFFGIPSLPVSCSKVFAVFSKQLKLAVFHYSQGLLPNSWGPECVYGYHNLVYGWFLKRWKHTIGSCDDVADAVCVQIPQSPQAVLQRCHCTSGLLQHRLQQIIPVSVWCHLRGGVSLPLVWSLCVLPAYLESYFLSTCMHFWFLFLCSFSSCVEV